MTTGSLGLRSSGSYGSLQQQQQIQNGSSSPPMQTQAPVSRKPPKVLKEKEKLFQWVFKVTPRKEVGMLLLCLASVAVLVLVSTVGKGEDPLENVVARMKIVSGPSYDEKVDANQTQSPQSMVADGRANYSVPSQSMVADGRVNYSVPSQSMVADGRVNYSVPSQSMVADGRANYSVPSQSMIADGRANYSVPSPSPPPPAVFFTGYELPPGNPCEGFVLPPPPADKKRTGPRPCPVCYLPLEDAIALMPKAPSFSPVLKDLKYIKEDNLTKSEFGGSKFGGYSSLEQRTASYDIQESMSIHCGFVKGVQPGYQTGFEIDKADLLEMETCREIVISSAIFGAYDIIRQPKNVSEYTRKNACFHMFVDGETEAFLRNRSDLGVDKKVGLWRIIVVHDLPYSDPRRNGKIPKLLLHRLFPNARYSMWVDAKLELLVDPILILERFLWRSNASFAISIHYKRFDVFVEAEANKAAAKYDNSSIDFQIEFYKKEGLMPNSGSKLLYESDVPEGCVIIREHIPITNLFTCLWFNEVDRFTSRDQLSFSTVRDKIWSKTNYTINMFKDCQRRNFVEQGQHRDILEHWSPLPPQGGGTAPIHPPPPVIINEDNLPIKTEDNLNKSLPVVLSSISIPSSPVKKVSTKRGKDRRSRRHRKVIAGSKDARTS